MFSELPVTLQVQSYIAHPYWPEMAQVIDIQKKSGVNRVRSETKRDEALKRYLETQGMTVESYQALVKQSEEPFYRNAAGAIIIPRHQLSGCLVQACQSAPSGARIGKDQLRSLIQISDFETDRAKRDRVFSRFVKPTDGKGNPLSNQRTLRENDVIENFEALGTLSIDTDEISIEVVLKLLTYAGKYIGLGASRKMGYGRFTVQADKNALTAAA